MVKDFGKVEERLGTRGTLDLFADVVVDFDVLLFVSAIETTLKTSSDCNEEDSSGLDNEDIL